MKYNFMKTNKNNFPIERMAEILEVSKSGYYSWIDRPESDRKIRNYSILKKIKEIHEKSNRNYGSERIHSSLEDEGLKCNVKTVSKIMKDNGIRAKTKRKFKHTTDSNHSNPVFENILNRQFDVKEKDKVWVSDITYIHTEEGWLYLCVVIDLFSRKVVGWSMGGRISADLVIKAFNMAWNNRNPKTNIIFHSDRGSQYTSKAFQKVLKDKKIVICSMSRKGNCWDNACAESFFHTLKTEEVNHDIYLTKEIAKIKIFEYIECYYNNYRKHSHLGLLNPNEFEKQKSA